MTEQIIDFEDEEDSSSEERKPYWFCEECCHESHTRQMPKDREKWYQGKGWILCPKGKSESFHPVGF